MPSSAATEQVSAGTMFCGDDPPPTTIPISDAFSLARERAISAAILPLWTFEWLEASCAARTKLLRVLQM
jgi:hypothetical protein